MVNAELLDSVLLERLTSLADNELVVGKLVVVSIGTVPARVELKVAEDERV